MKDTVWLRCNVRGVQGMTKNEPHVKPGEITVRCRIEVPDSVFRTPTADAHLIVPEDVALHPTAEVVVEVPEGLEAQQ